MIHFQDAELLWLLLPVTAILYFLKKNPSSLENLFSQRVLQHIRIPARSFSKKGRMILLITAFLFGIIALARPQIDHGQINVKSSFIDIVVGFDISRSMFANDIYPSRFAMAREKFYDLLDDLKNAKVAIIGFSSRGFLIAPLTQDFNSLRFLAKNMSLDQLRLRGTNILTPLEVSNELFKEEKKKALLLFTDGGDGQSYDKEIAYARAHDITVFVYNIGTKKGGVIADEQGALKDSEGNIVVVKRNDAIRELAIESGGAYMHSSLKHHDIRLLADAIRSKFKAQTQEESTIRETQELFYYPLALSILLFLSAISSLPRRKHT
jgi:Ca-activated chloride channel family protein